MYPQDTIERGMKKLVDHCGTYYYLSANDKDCPDRNRAIEDDIAIRIAEEFETSCGGSSERVSEQLVNMQRYGGITMDTKKGRHTFHIRRKSGSKVALEIVK